MFRIVSFFVAGFVAYSTANAGVIGSGTRTFDLTVTPQGVTPVSGRLGTDQITITQMFTVAGESFFADIFIEASSPTGQAQLSQNSNGLGVSGRGSELVSDGQSLLLSVGNIQPSGAVSVTFDGFSSVDTNSINGSTVGGPQQDQVFFSGTGITDFSVLGKAFDFQPEIDIVDIEDLGGGLAENLTAQAKFTDPNDGGRTTTFRLTSIDATFTVSQSSNPPVIPEPGTMAAFGLLGVVSLRRYRRRK
ncbi:MAG: PEP-CTERM sorting domain-containing protein [Planctomycetota bacterium]